MLSSTDGGTLQGPSTHPLPARLCMYICHHLHSAKDQKDFLHTLAFSVSWTFISVLPRGCFHLPRARSGHQLVLMVMEPDLHGLRSFCPNCLQPMRDYFPCFSKTNSPFGHLQRHREESPHLPHPAASAILPVPATSDCRSQCAVVPADIGVGWTQNWSHLQTPGKVSAMLSCAGREKGQLQNS